jgi:hypothetical protein
LRQGIEPVSQFRQGHFVELCIVERLLDLIELALQAVELRLLALSVGIRRLRNRLGRRGRTLPGGGRGSRGLRPCGGRQEGAGDQRRDGEPKLSPGLQPYGVSLGHGSHERPSPKLGAEASRWNRHSHSISFRLPYRK